MTDHEILTAQLLFLRENNVISADIYQKLHTFNSESVLSYKIIN